MEASTTRPEIRGATLWPPDTERAYRERFLRDDSRLAGTFVALATVSFGAFALEDVRFAATGDALARTLAARLAFFLIGAVAAWRIWRARRPSAMDAWVVAWSVAFALRAIAGQSIRPLDHYAPLLGDLAVCLCLWLVVPVPLRLQAVVAVVVTTGVAVWMLAFRSPPPHGGWRPVVAAWILGNVTAAYASWRGQRQRRGTYLDGLRLAAAEEAARAHGAALAESEAHYRSLIDNIRIGVVVHAPDSAVVLANPRASELLGLSPDQMRGKAAIDPAWRFVRGDETTMPIEEYPVSQVLATGRPVKNLLAGIDRPGSGGRVWVVADAYPGRAGDGGVEQVVVTFAEITEVRALQAQVALTARLASMGTLVAGIAHEVNNPLGGAIASHGFVAEEAASLRALLESNRDLDRAALARRLARVEEALADALGGEERVASIVKDLALFARPDARRTRVSLAHVVGMAMRWVPAGMRERATIAIEDRGAPEVVASDGQLSQVVVNLVTNAIKAGAPGSGSRVRIELGPGAPGMARLEVSDDGIGIPADVLPRIFDPFFTTRSGGKGMGLGLAISHAIVTAHGGTITASSEVGKGTTFRVELPVAPAMHAA